MRASEFDIDIHSADCLVCHNRSDDGAEAAKSLQKLIEEFQKQDFTSEIRHVLGLLLPSSPLYDFILQLDPPDYTSTSDASTNSYIPWQPPTLSPPPSIHELPLSQALPASSLTFSSPPQCPKPCPPVIQIVHHAETNLACLVTLTLQQEHAEREEEEKEVQKRRKRLGAGSESQVRRAVARDALLASKVSSVVDFVVLSETDRTFGPDAVFLRRYSVSSGNSR